MEAISHWTPLRMRSPRWSEALLVLKIEGSRRWVRSATSENADH